jgi:putative membrane protein
MKVLATSTKAATSQMDGGELRDRLAVVRTQLANERTLLAYVRTGLAVGAGGAALLQFFSEHTGLRALAWLLIVAGVVVLAAGAYRFRSVRKNLPR